MAFTSCKLQNDMLRSNSCSYSLPEIIMIYLANYEDVTGYTVSGNEITSIALADSAKFYKIEPAKNSASFEDALVVTDNGRKYRTHTLTFSVVGGKYDAERSFDLDMLSVGKFIAVVKTAEGNYICLGREVGLEADTATFSGGGDTDGIQVVMSHNMAESAWPLSADAIEDVEG